MLIRSIPFSIGLKALEDPTQNLARPLRDYDSWDTGFGLNAHFVKTVRKPLQLHIRLAIEIEYSKLVHEPMEIDIEFKRHKI